MNTVRCERVFQILVKALLLLLFAGSGVAPFLYQGY